MREGTDIFGAFDPTKPVADITHRRACKPTSRIPTHSSGLCAPECAEQNRHQRCLGRGSSPDRVTLLSDGPPRRGPRLAPPPASPSGGRRGFGTIPSLLRGARACSATPKAGTPPSAGLSLVFACWPWEHCTSCKAFSPYTPECMEKRFGTVNEVDR